MSYINVSAIERAWVLYTQNDIANIINQITHFYICLIKHLEK